MKINSFYPVVMTDELKACANFFIKYFGFRITFEAGWYISMIDENNNELAFLKHNHETVPTGFRALQSGLLLNIELDNVDEIYDLFIKDLRDKIRLDIKSEIFGQRHFIIEAPGKLLVDVIQIIEPSEEYKENYEQE